MRGPLPVALLLLATVLAGCSGGSHRPPAGDAGDDPSASPLEPEEDNAVFQVEFTVPDAATVEVPFPHLESCLQPEHWLNGTTEVSGAVPELRDASEGRSGRVLSLAAQGGGKVRWSSQVDLADHPTCQNVRADPWSTDPDPTDNSVEVRVTQGSASGISLLARWVRGGCGQATLYEGEPGQGWTALEGRTIPAGCA
jgi:hypothetical protein